MVEGSSYMFITGPDVVKTVTGEEVSFEELGGAITHATKSGVAQFVSPDEEACLEDARYLISFLPQNNVDPPPYAEPADPAGREDAELNTLIPDDPAKPYDMKEVVRRVVDDGEFLEVHERWAENLICGFARLNGHVIGVVGNQPRALAGVLDIDSSVKGARSSPSSTFPASCPGRRRSGAASSATARSCCTPTPRRRCRSWP
jgi:propionyl-CoA carboxylase beta chain